MRETAHETFERRRRSRAEQVDYDVSILLQHIRPAFRADGQAASELKQRLSDTKGRIIKYECFYAREWFAKFFDSDRSLVIHKLKVSKWKIVKHLERFFSAAMTEKILNQLDIFCNDEVYFKTFVEKLKSKLIFARPDQILKFCFDLYDYNDNKFICLQDMAKFNLEFAGLCSELVHDYNDISAIILRKRKIFE